MSGQKTGGGEASSPAFTSFYLQQATQEFAEDLDKARTADDFKGDALPMLIRALQQGTALFAPADQQRVVRASAGQQQQQQQQQQPDAEMADAATGTSSSGASSDGTSSSDDEK